MSASSRFLVFLTLCLSLSLPQGGAAFAQTLTPADELRTLLNEIKEQGDKAKCYEKACKVIDMANDLPAKPSGEIYYILCHVSHHLTLATPPDYKKALYILLKLEKLYRGSHGPQHHFVGNIVRDLAELYVKWGKRDKAEKVYINLFRNVATDEGWPNYSIDTAATEVAKFYRDQGDNKLAAKILKIPFLRRVKKAKLQRKLNAKFMQEQRLAYAKALNRHRLPKAYHKALIKAMADDTVLPDDELIWPKMWKKAVADAKDGDLESETKEAVTRALLARQGLSKKSLGKAVPFVRPSGLSGWSKKVSHTPLTTPAIRDNRIYLSGGFSETHFYALAQETGEKVWTFKASDTGPTPPVAEGEYVAYTTESCTLYLHNAEDGKLLWSKWLGAHLLSQPALTSEFVYTAYPTSGADFRLGAFANNSGMRLWEAKIASEVLGGPVLAGNALYAATADGSLYHLDRDTGNILWSSNVQASSAPVLDGGKLLLSYRFPSKDGEGSRQFLGYVDLGKGNPQGFENGAPKMRQQKSLSLALAKNYRQKQDEQVKRLGLKKFGDLFHYSGMRPCVLADKVILTDIDRVRAVDRKSGEHLWDRCFDIKFDVHANQRYVGENLLTTVVPAGDSVYTCTADGRVICLRAKDGKTLFDEKLTDEPFQFEPAISRGKVYAVTTKGTLICLETGNPQADGWPMWGGGPGHNGFSKLWNK